MKHSLRGRECSKRVLITKMRSDLNYKEAAVAGVWTKARWENGGGKTSVKNSPWSTDNPSFIAEVPELCTGLEGRANENIFLRY